MKNQKFNWYNYQTQPGEVNNLPSLTVPDQTLSLRELVARFTRGQNVATFEPVFDDDADSDLWLPDTNRMTFDEKIDYLENLKDQTAAVKSDLLKRSKKKSSPPSGQLEIGKETLSPTLPTSEQK